MLSGYYSYARHMELYKQFFFIGHLQEQYASLVLSVVLLVNQLAWFYPQHMRGRCPDSRSSANLILHLIFGSLAQVLRCCFTIWKKPLLEQESCAAWFSAVQFNAMLWLPWRSAGSTGSRDRWALHSSRTN